VTSANGNGKRRRNILLITTDQPPFILSLSKDGIRQRRLSLSKPPRFTARRGAIL
jgi:hypothetical protein